MSDKLDPYRVADALAALDFSARLNLASAMLDGERPSESAVEIAYVLIDRVRTELRDAIVLTGRRVPESAGADHDDG